MADSGGKGGWRRGESSCYQAKERHSGHECGRGESTEAETQAPGLEVHEGIMGGWKGKLKSCEFENGSRI